MGDVFRVDGSVALVTGSCQGLGKAIAERLGEAGATVVVTGLAEEAARGEEVARRAGGVFLTADLSVEEECRSLVRRAVERCGRVDLLVNCAAVNPRATLLETTSELYKTIFRVNLLAPFLLTQEFVSAYLGRDPSLQRGASIVNVASVQAHGGAPFSMAYASLKAALVAQTKNNAQELASLQIRCNSVLPGWMPTEAEHVLQTDLGAPRNWVAQADAGAPMGRLLRPRECADAVLYLLSDAARMTTGTAMEIHPEMVVGCLPPGTGNGKRPQGSKL